MSLYKSAKSPFYSYDFQIDGRRFHGSTKATSKKEAEAVERQLKAQARTDLKQEKVTGNGPLTLDLAAGRYWQEKGQYLAASEDIWRDLERLIKYFGKDKRLDEITDREVAALVAWRRGQTIKGRKKDAEGNPVRTVSHATVNRSTTGVLRTLFSRAKKPWRYSFPFEPDWKSHWLEEPREVIRELHDHQAEALESAIRDDYAPWLEFARLTGMRLSETLLTWDMVNWGAGTITTRGKRGKLIHMEITPSMREILEAAKGHHPEAVFTYICQRNTRGLRKGQRYPINYEAAKTRWQRDRKKAGLKDFRFHDLRHDFATRYLRLTGNLKQVSLALGHSDLRMTSKYAHVLTTEVAAGRELVAKSRKKSRSLVDNTLQEDETA